MLIFELQFWAWNCSFHAQLRRNNCRTAIPIAATAIKIAGPQLKLQRPQLIAVWGGWIAVQNRGKSAFRCGGRNSIAVTAIQLRSGAINCSFGTCLRHFGLQFKRQTAIRGIGPRFKRQTAIQTAIELQFPQINCGGPFCTAIRIAELQFLLQRCNSELRNSRENCN